MLDREPIHTPVITDGLTSMDMPAYLKGCLVVAVVCCCNLCLVNNLQVLAVEESQCVAWKPSDAGP